MTGILTQCSQLHKESIDLSKIQEYLNIPEPFLFEGGAQPPAASGYRASVGECILPLSAIPKRTF